MYLFIYLCFGESLLSKFKDCRWAFSSFINAVSTSVRRYRWVVLNTHIWHITHFNFVSSPEGPWQKKDYSKEVRGRQKNVNNRWCRVCASDANYTTTKYACRISEDSYICARARCLDVSTKTSRNGYLRDRDVREFTKLTFDHKFILDMHIYFTFWNVINFAWLLIQQIILFV